MMYIMYSSVYGIERTVDCDVVEKKIRTIKNKKLCFFRHTYFGFGFGLRNLLRFFLLFRSVPVPNFQGRSTFF